MLFVILFLSCENLHAAGEDETNQIERVQQETEESILEKIDFTEINETIESLLPGEKLQFEDLVAALTNGNFEDIGSLCLDFIIDQISYEFRTNRQNLIHILLIAILAAVFTNLANAVQSRQISDIGFYIIYMLLITICLNSFRVTVAGIEESMENILDFMRVFCPGYFLAMAVSSGSTSAVWFYNLVLLLIYLIEMLLLRFLIPVIHIYIMVQVMNYLFPEDMLGKLAGLLKKFVEWFLKAVFGIVVGINIVQGLLAPALDVLKRSTVTKTLESLPGLGNLFGSAADVILGTAVLLKNGIGMAGAIILLLICAIPILQLVLFAFLYQLIAALVQPVTDKRITECISSVGEGYGLLLKLLLTTMFLFLLTIAIAATVTS